MKLHHNNRAGLLAALAVALGLAAMPASAGIFTTKHNLGTTGSSSTHLTAGTGASDLCVFCHTPHGSVAGGGVPLWNKYINSAQTYTTYTTAISSTIDGTVVGGSSLTGSPSLACLTCHDGTSSMDSLINAPGSGGYNATGARIASAAWQGNADGTGKMTQGAGLMNMLGTDLSNDHPIAIQYCGGSTMVASGNALSNGAAPTNMNTCNDQDFVGPQTVAGVGLLSATSNSVGLFWINTDAGVTRTKTDLPLYTSASNGPTVECGSCHDPHSSAQATFLRISNSGSAVCLACHVK